MQQNSDGNGTHMVLFRLKGQGCTFPPGRPFPAIMCHVSLSGWAMILGGKRDVGELAGKWGVADISCFCRIEINLNSFYLQFS